MAIKNVKGVAVLTEQLLATALRTAQRIVLCFIASSLFCEAS